jgi:hypothetical protein
MSQRFDQPADFPWTTPYGPLDGLWAAIRQHTPDVTGDCNLRPADPAQRAPGEPELYMDVKTGQAGPYRVVYDFQTAEFCWNNGPHAGAALGPLDDIEHVARHIASLLHSLQPRPLGDGHPAQEEQPPGGAG